MLPLARTGVPEESYFTFTYSPIRDESSGVGGVFCAVVETTDKVIEERRLRLLNALAEAARARTPAAACVHAAAESRARPTDVPFALLYLLDDSGVATLAGAANIDAGSALAPAAIRPGDDGPWPLEQVRTMPLHGPVADAASGRARRRDPADRARRRRPALRLRRRGPQPDAVAEPRPTRAFTRCSRPASRRASAAPPPTRRSASGPRRSPSSIAPRPRSSATSVTNSGRR